MAGRSKSTPRGRELQAAIQIGSNAAASIGGSGRLIHDARGVTLNATRLNDSTGIEPGTLNCRANIRVQAEQIGWVVLLLDGQQS